MSELVTIPIDVKDPELMEMIIKKAAESNITPDELVSRIVTEYAAGHTSLHTWAWSGLVKGAAYNKAEQEETPAFFYLLRYGFGYVYSSDCAGYFISDCEL